MSDEERDLSTPLEAWLGERLGQAVEVGEVASHGTGYSAETIVVPYREVGGGEDRRVVLRLECPEPAIYPVQAPGLDVEVEIQFRAMEGLAAATKVPLAPLIGLERDPAVLGQPFYVMGFVDGVVPIVNPPYTKEGFFAEATPEERRRLVESGLRALAEIHAADWEQAGFDWLVPPGTTPGTRAQLELWEAFARRELGERVHPLLDRSFAWLYANLPEDRSLAISWGDSRPGNIIYRDFEPVCLTDFENIAVAPPEFDLGWWLMFDWTMHEADDLPRLEGEPTREEQRDFYARVSGRELHDVTYHEIFAAARYCAIVVRVTNRYVDRGLFPKDHGIWLDNPPAKVLAMMMDRLA